jgi:hypothetical protein
MVKWLHVGVRLLDVKPEELTFVMRTATKHFAFNRQSQAARNALWAKVKAQKYLEICKLKHPFPLI